MSVDYDDASFEYFRINKLYGGCTLTGVAPGIPALKSRCTVLLKAYVGTQAVGTNRLVFVVGLLEHSVNPCTDAFQVFAGHATVSA